MDATIWVGGSQLLARLDQVNGRQGAAIHALLMNFELRGRPDLVGTTLGFDADVTVSVDGRHLYAGHAYASERPSLFTQLPNGELINPRAQLTLIFSPQQLEIVEQFRRGQDVDLLLDVHGIALRGGEAEPFFGQLRYRLDPGSWVRLLSEMNFAKLVELLVPLGGSAAEAKREAADRLELALGDVAAGRYREAIRKCRDLLEALYSESDAEYKEFKPTFPDSRSAGKAARYYFIRQAVLTMTHAAAHDDETSRTFDWQRKDAQTIIAILAALLQTDP